MLSIHFAFERLIQEFVEDIDMSSKILVHIPINYRKRKCKKQDLCHQEKFLTSCLSLYTVSYP